MNEKADRVAPVLLAALAVLAAGGAARAESTYLLAARPDAFVEPAATAPDPAPCPPGPADAPAPVTLPCVEAEVRVYTNADLAPYAVPPPQAPDGRADRATGEQGWDYVTRVLDRSYERLDADRYYRLDESGSRDVSEEPPVNPFRGRLALAPRFWWGPCFGCIDDRPRRPRRPRAEPRPPLDGRDAFPVRTTPPHDRTPIASPTPATGVRGSRFAAPGRGDPRRGARAHDRRAGGRRGSASGAAAVPRRITPPHRRQPAQAPEPSRGRSGGG